MAASRDDLYALTPGEFVAARNQLAKELKQAGKPAEAKEVAALKKPSAIAAAVDRAARKHAAAVEALIAADDKLRKAQAGGAGAESLKAAMGAHRDALRAVALAAEKELPSVSPQQSRAIQTTLQGAVAGGADLRDRLRRGVLDDELAPPGFDLLADLGASLAVNARAKEAPAAAAHPPAAKHEPAAKAEAPRKTKADAAQEKAEARAAKKAAAGEARQAARAAAAERKAGAEELKRAKAAATAAKRRAEQLEQAAAKAEQHAARAREAAQRAEEAAKEAKAAAAEARKKADEAARAARSG